MSAPAQELLVADNDELRLFMLSPAMLCVTDSNARFRRVNPALEKNLGYAEAELLSRSLLELVHPEDLDGTLNELRRLSKRSASINVENRVRHATGTYRWLLWNMAHVADEGLLYATATDITERKELDARNCRLQTESEQLSVETARRLEKLTNRLLLAEERERRRIARGLHDNVGQSLLTAKMTVQELGSDLTGEKKVMAEELLRSLDRTIKSTRTLMFDLASEALYDVGLGAAMQSLCARAQQQSGIEFQPPESLKGNPIPESARVIVYRVGRELIQNVVKHSEAQTAKVSLTLSRGLVRLTVQDDGCGFGDEKRRRDWNTETSFGLFSIEQQLRPLHGMLEIISAPGCGTQAVVIFPVDGKEAP